MCKYIDNHTVEWNLFPLTFLQHDMWKWGSNFHIQYCVDQIVSFILAHNITCVFYTRISSLISFIILFLASCPVSILKTISSGSTFFSLFLLLLHPLLCGTIDILHILLKLLWYHSHYISLFRIDYIILACLLEPRTIWKMLSFVNSESGTKKPY